MIFEYRLRRMSHLDVIQICVDIGEKTQTVTLQRVSLDILHNNYMIQITRIKLF